MSSPPSFPALDCPDCETAGALVLSRTPAAWKSRKPWTYLCTTPGCRGLLSAHPDGSPQGTPADAATRRARRLTHALLDPLWLDAPRCYAIKEEGPARKRAERAIRQRARLRTYAWLADQLGIPPEECHVAMMDIPLLRRAYVILRGANFHTIRDWAKAREGQP